MHADKLGLQLENVCLAFSSFLVLSGKFLQKTTEVYSPKENSVRYRPPAVAETFLASTNVRWHDFTTVLQEGSKIVMTVSLSDRRFWSS